MRLTILGLCSAILLLSASGCTHHQLRGASCATGNCGSVSSDCGADACNTCPKAKVDWKAKLFPCNRKCTSDCNECRSCGIPKLGGGLCGGLCDGGGAPYSRYTPHGPRDFFATSPRPLGP